MSSQPIQSNAPLDLDAIRTQLSSVQGPQFWRSLEEVARTPEFQAYLDHEFTPGTSDWTDPVSRRRLVELLGATLGLAGLTACTKQPPEAIVPYVKAPEEFIPGKPLYYATAIPVSGYSDGVLVESHMGRPTKVEGNPEHPASLGSTDVFRQASILTLYDPDRSQAVAREGRISSWVHFLATAAALRETLLSNRGAGFRILTETITSPSLLAALRALLAELPEAKWCQFEPVSRQNVHDGTRLAFGEVLHPVYHVDKAEVIVSLDADLFGSGPGAVRYSRDFAARRKVGGASESQPKAMNRLYVVEPCPSITGGIADHRLALPVSEIEKFARALAAELGAVSGLSAPASSQAHAWVKAVASDLLRHKGAGLVAAGAQQSATVHALAHAINTALGNNGATVSYLDPIETASPQSLPELAREMESGKVSTLLMLGGNPLYSSPADLNFAEVLRKVKLRIHLGEYDDETSAVCHWHINEAHPLESWGDTRAYDGTITVQQPLIDPLYNGRAAIEVISALAGRPGVSSHDLVKEFWRARYKDASAPDSFRSAKDLGADSVLPQFTLDEAWQKQVHDGFIPASAGAGKRVTLARDLGAVLASAAAASIFELNFRPDPSAYDGRFANNAWLQELPRPITKITWDNAVLLSPAAAQKLNLVTGEVVELRHSGRVLRAPVCIVPGHADASLTLHLGYGRWRGGRIANNVGSNANRLRTSSQLWSMSGVEVVKTGGKHLLAITQEHNSMEGRNLIRSATLAEYIKKPDFAQEGEHAVKNPLSLFPEYKYEGYSWGMAIDLNACTGCNACTIACQAENNIAVVGKSEVLRGREMHWIRLDRYFEGSLDNPTIHHQPVACMQCDNAPCEVVCPVAATSHSSEGLNQMTYNRCVGTRYCANNCPYKVRRFNFFLYGDWESKSLHGLRNPDVTVRSRGVMEKCTYCVQRINLARIEAEKEDRRIADGEVVSACQAVCPAQAISFGDLNDPKSRVSKVKADSRNYGLLTDLNTRPRTTYLARVRNPNLELEKA
ncbi:MAG: TAT-variant-translocated molybdopterin oxidoreductase [Acidobacteriia bacterium]|nr:TAT-variant-translocated molybdopterin oxidoreductase [Terriglobia bacterium]